jgi:hypothetical protein
MLGLLEYPGPGMVGANEHEVAEVKLSKEDFAHYIGTYRGTSPPARLAHVWDDDDRLHIRIGEAGALTGRRSHLVPLGDHRFALGLYRDEHLEAIDPRTTIRFTVEDGEGKALETVEAGEVELSAQRADLDQIRTEVEAERSRVSIAEIVSKTLEAEGVEAARARHRALRTSRPDSIRFGESLLGTLGFRLLSEGRVEESIAVFEMNAEAFPDAANSYNWLGDAYALAGLGAASRSYERAVALYGHARRNYERAVELAEQQKHRDLATYRYKLAFVRQRLEGH